MGGLCTALRGVSRHQKARTVVKVGAEGVNLPQGRSCKNKRGAARACFRAGDIARCLRSESPSAATEDLKAKQQTLGASGNDRQNDDHAPGIQLEGRTKLEQARSRADWSKIMVLHDWTTTGLL